MDTYNKVDVHFHTNVKDSLLQFAVVIARYKNQFIFVKHKQRDTLEFPGGRREMNESIIDCAKRELYEETGALEFELTPISIYSVKGKTRANLNGNETYGMLYKANITKLGDLPKSEIEKIIITTSLPTQWTYPEIQPYLLKKYKSDS